MTTPRLSTVGVRPARARRQRPAPSLFAAVALLVRRRLWRDRGLILSSALIVMLATLLAYAGPQLVISTIDAGARDAVTAAGPGADLNVTFPVGNTGGDNVDSVRGIDPAEFVDHAHTIANTMPSLITDLIETQSNWVVSPWIAIHEVAAADTIALAQDTDLPPVFTRRARDAIQIGHAPGTAMTVIEGRLPVERGAGATPPAPVDTDDRPLPPVFEVALTPEVAAALDLGIGDLLKIRSIRGKEIALEIVGIVVPAEPELPIWEQFPLLSPQPPDELAMRRGTIIVSSRTLAGITNTLETPHVGTVSFAINPNALTLDNSVPVANAVRDTKAKAGELLPDSNVSVLMRTSLDETLNAYPPRARTALAQMSVVVAGVVAVAAVVIALMARLLISRREREISLERARGASVPSIVLRLLVESMLFTALGFAAGYAAATALVGPIPALNLIAIIVIVVAALASPLLGMRLARRTWTGRREAANRQDREKVRKAKATRRLTLEALAVVLGVLAVMTLRARGVLQTQTAQIDLFLAAAPVLLALAVTVVVVRLYSIPLAAIQYLAKRTRGVAGIIALAKARDKVPVLPLLALTIAIAVAISSGLLVGTVREGQEQASWERVGGQVRVDAHVDDDTAAELERQGVTVSRLYLREYTTFTFGTATQAAQLLAVEDSYAAVLAASGLDDPAEYTVLADLNAARAPGDPLPVLASQELIDFDFGGPVTMFVGRIHVPVTIVGLATVVPEGWVDGPYALAPLDGLLEYEFGAPVESNVAFVFGDGAEVTVTLSSVIDPQDVTTRSGWLDAARNSALIGGVERIMTTTVVVVAILAAFALLVTVLQGVRDRGRALSMFRTQGMGSGYGWWLSLTELAPLTVAAVLGGTVAGLSILLLLGETLGLEVLAGGVDPPDLMVSPEFLLAVGVGVMTLLFIAVAAEVVAHRRNKLSEVLRYGDSR